MDIAEWITQAARIRNAWRLKEDSWNVETVQEYYELLSWMPAETVRDAITSLAEDGPRTAPTVADIRKRAFHINPNLGKGKQSDLCICAQGVGKFRECQANHGVEGWEERRELEENAAKIIDSNDKVDPAAYPGPLGDAIQALLLRQFYDKNLAGGRAIDDAGDEHGCPTKGKGAGCVVNMI